MLLLVYCGIDLTLACLLTSVQVSFLTLATKASDALLQAGDTAHAVELLEASAAFVDTLSALATDVPGLPKALLSHYCARVEASIKAKNMSVARWMMEKAKDLCSTGSLSEREVRSLYPLHHSKSTFLSYRRSNALPEWPMPLELSASRIRNLGILGHSQMTA